MNICKECTYVTPHEREYWCGHPRFTGVDYVTGERLIRKCVEARESDLEMHVEIDPRTNERRRIFIKPNPVTTCKWYKSKKDLTRK